MCCFRERCSPKSSISPNKPSAVGVSCLGFGIFGVSLLGFGIFGFRGFAVRVSGLGYRVSFLRFRVWVVGFKGGIMCCFSEKLERGALQSLH